MIEVILGDGIKIMEAMEQKNVLFDMIFLDPPYFDWPTGEKKPDHNVLSFLSHRLLKDDGVVFLCGTTQQLLDDLKYWTRWFRFLFDIIIVKKGIFPHSSFKFPKKYHENIWCFCKKNIKTNDLKLDLRRTKQINNQKKRLANVPSFYNEKSKDMMNEYAGYMRSVFFSRTIDNHSYEYVGHPTQKSLKLMCEIVKFSTEEGDFVLDPFAGSGTTGVACLLENRKCLLIEINKKYVKMIKERLRTKSLNDLIKK